jgi:hypothetical protein
MFWYYSRFGTKLNFIFGLANRDSYRDQIQNQLPIKPITHPRLQAEQTK